MAASDSSLSLKTAVELHSLLRARQITCTSLLQEHVDRINRFDPTIRAYLSLRTEKAFEEAALIDRALDRGEDLPFLAGIPVAVKDNICMRGEITTCSSRILENFVAPYDATAISKMKEHHLIVLGKTNMDEFAMGSSTENSAFFTTENPWKTECVPGGSSGGSAAAVAAGEAVLALGSDTGGSIRQPASFCGISGLKPTYGRVSRYGLVAFASSLDQIGPFARSVEDIAHFMNVISGHDPADSTSAEKPAHDFTKALRKDIKGLKIGVPRPMLSGHTEENVRQALVAALDRLKENGASWEVVDFDSFEHAVSIYYIIAPAEASSNLARFDGVRYGFRASDTPSLREMYHKTRGQGFGPEVQRRIILGTYVLSSGYYDAYYLKAQKVRTLIRRDFERLFQTYDAIISPTSPSVAFKRGEHSDDPMAMYLADIATIPANMAGLPAMSIPAGFGNGLPIGMQIVGPAFGEDVVLQIGHAFQQITDWHHQFPVLEEIHGI